MMKSRVACMLILACRASLPAAAQDVTLVPGPGKDVVEAGCSICHTLSYIPMNSRFMVPDVWKAEVAKMRTAFGAPIDDDAASAIVTYLVANYGVPAK
jgi:mono/diheme cytochrome c family protein